MRKILIATTNHNKVSRIKRLLVDASVEIVSLADLPTELPEPAETAGSGIAIAAQKALGYVEHVDDGTIVLTQDDTISFEGVASEDNPGAFIKEPVRSIMQLSINGEWIYYTELNEEQKIKADDDIKSSILSLLQEVA